MWPLSSSVRQMARIIALAVLSILLVACASAPPRSDRLLQYDDTSSQLTFAAGLGPFKQVGGYLEIPGYVFGAGYISLHPGEHRIAYACPGDWTWKMITHYVPSVVHDFKVGRKYELYCSNGYPLIRELDPDE